MRSISHQFVNNLNVLKKVYLSDKTDSSREYQLQIIFNSSVYWINLDIFVRDNTFKKDYNFFIEKQVFAVVITFDILISLYGIKSPLQYKQLEDHKVFLEFKAQLWNRHWRKANVW